jgi:hypothetical protein
VSWGRLQVGDESYIAVEVVAQAFRLEMSLVVAIVDLELIGPVRVAEHHLYVPSHQLDRLAEIVRWHVAFDVPLERVELLLGH